MSPQTLAETLFIAVAEKSGKSLAPSILEVPGEEYFPTLEEASEQLAGQLNDVAMDCGAYLQTHGSSETQISPADLVDAINNVQHGTELCPGIIARLEEI